MIWLAVVSTGSAVRGRNLPVRAAAVGKTQKYPLLFLLCRYFGLCFKNCRLDMRPDIVHLCFNGGKSLPQARNGFGFLSVRSLKNYQPTLVAIYYRSMIGYLLLDRACFGS